MTRKEKPYTEMNLYELELELAYLETQIKLVNDQISKKVYRHKPEASN